MQLKKHHRKLVNRSIEKLKNVLLINSIYGLKLYPYELRLKEYMMLGGDLSVSKKK